MGALLIAFILLVATIEPAQSATPLIPAPFYIDGSSSDTPPRRCGPYPLSPAILHPLDRTMYSAYGPRNPGTAGSKFHQGVDYCRQAGNNGPLIYTSVPVSIDYIHISPAKGGNVLFVTTDDNDTFGFQHIFQNLPKKDHLTGVKRSGLELREFRVPPRSPISVEYASSHPQFCNGIFAQDWPSAAPSFPIGVKNVVLVDRQCTLTDGEIFTEGFPGSARFNSWTVRKKVPAGHWLAPVGNSATGTPHLHLYYKSKPHATSAGSPGLCSASSPCLNPLVRLTHPAPSYLVRALRVNPANSFPQGFENDSGPTVAEHIPKQFYKEPPAASQPKLPYKFWIDVDYSLGYFTSATSDANGSGFDFEKIEIWIENDIGLKQGSSLIYDFNGRNGGEPSPPSISSAKCGRKPDPGKDCGIYDEGSVIPNLDNVTEALFVPAGNDSTSKKHVYFLSEIPDSLTECKFTIKAQAHSVSAGALEAKSIPFEIASRPPIAVKDSARTDPNTPVTINVKANDSDPDGTPIAKLKVTDPVVVGGDAKGKVFVNSDGTLTFTPAAGGTGSVTILYSLTDDCGVHSEPAEVTVTIATATHWAGTYSITSCTQRLGQWYWIDPCIAYLPIAGDSGRFFFSDDSDNVTFESSYFGRSVRGVVPLRWRSTESAFEFGAPTQRLTSGYICTHPSGLPGWIEETGEMLYSFTIVTRSATTMGGTFAASMKSGYLSKTILEGGFCVEDWRTIPVSASGTWTASLQQTGMPIPQLNGFDYCTDSNLAVRGCGAIYGTYIEAVGSCARAPGACRFQ